MKINNLFKDVGIGLISLLLFLSLLVFAYSVLFENLDKMGLDNEHAFRTSSELIKEPLFFDSEAIALSDSSSDTGLRSVAMEASNLVNEIRAEAGLNELTWDTNLETVANVRASEISENFSHTRPNGRQWYTVNSKIQGGENLAYGFDNAEDVVEAWMNSPTHKENILYDEFEKVAISIYEEDGVYYYAQEYGY